MTAALLSAEGVTVRLANTLVLDRVSLRLGRGEIVTLLGPNGSGKTTLVRALVGAIAPDAGRILRAPGLRIGYVPQRLHVDRSLPITVRRFLSLPLAVSAAEASRALSRVGLGVDLLRRQLAALSGGQTQRVLLARALLSEPQVLILDEPTQGLDQQGEAGFYRLIEDIRRDTQASILMVSHDLHVVMAASDRVICLNGHVCCEGTPSVVSSAPEYRALFGLGTQGALALYRHHHDHAHDHHDHHDGHAHDHGHDHGDVHRPAHAEAKTEPDTTDA